MLEETLEEPIIESVPSRPMSNGMRMGIVAAIGASILVGLALLSNAMDHRTVSPASNNRSEFVAVTPGTVKEVCVQVGQVVNPGDAIINFDDTTEQTVLAEAQAKLQEVGAEVQGADVAIAIPGPMTLGGKIVQTAPLTGGGPIPVLPRATPSGKVERLPTVEGTPGAATPPASNEPSPKLKAEAEVKTLETEIQTGKDQVLTDQQSIDSTQAELDDAQRNADASKSIAANKRREADKMQMLLREGAVAQVEATRSDAMASSAEGASQAAQRMADELKAKIETTKAELLADQIKVAQKEKLLVAAKDRAAKAPDRVAVESSAPPVPQFEAAPAPRRSKPAFVRSGPSVAESHEPAKVAVDLGAKRETDSKMQAAKAAVDDAEKDVLARRVTAKRKGKIIQILVKPGSTVRAGETLVVIEYDSAK